MQSRVAEGLALVYANVERLRAELSLQRIIKIVAVSKTKPAELVREAYDAGQRLFGENYADELISKAVLCPADIQWHMIGHLQSNKIKKLLQIPNLVAVETIDSEKLAQKLNSECAKIGRAPLQVLVQVDTSGEMTKSGIDPAAVAGLATYIKEECPNIAFAGLMTIGKAGDEQSFEVMRETRRVVARELGVEEDTLELSMGMSADFEAAIRSGSTLIRVGSVIFGDRHYI